MDDLKMDKPQSQPTWEREEQVLLVVEYFSSKENKTDVDAHFLSELLRKRAIQRETAVSDRFRNENGIMLQVENMSHFDPSSGKLVTGHESKWMHEIMKEYVANPQKMLLEAYTILKNVGTN